MSQVMKRIPHDVLLQPRHNGCRFYEAKDGSIFVLTNPSFPDLVEQAAEILKCGYVLAGGIQVGTRRNAATFLLKVEEAVPAV